ncbi:acyl carrier protein [Kroppenstedtia pulmonis]|uniref:Acyl carrier protein n=1 Tax=Kroppenstedtia pulmonis TaxID=1380685 RepID=A0A7D3XQL1_9BACL|nr:acyl carrier protein [Kroppenstedtia pulmonis]QKG84482.1 acyl carrier protein [Kroppenstedtia pulmonis]
MTVKDKVKKLFVECYNFSFSPEEIGDDVILFGPESPYALDSMDILKFIATLKEEFEIDLGTIRTDTFSTINQITQTISEHYEESKA